MKIYSDDFLEGMQEMVSLYKQGNNIFEIPGGNQFPTNSNQHNWEIAQGNGAIHLSDGTHSYSFKGDLADYDSELERMPDVPLPEMFANATKHKAQVHRSDPGSIYFTVQEGRNNPTFTLRHMGNNKWKAIPKPKKIKDKLKEPVVPHNVNLESVKQGMIAEVKGFNKLSGLDSFLGKSVQGLANLPSQLALMPGRIMGPVTNLGDPNQEAEEPMESTLGKSLAMGGIGAGIGGLYHLAKRNLLNTQQENQQEDEEGGHLAKRMLMPAGLLGGATALDRRVFTHAMNNPNEKMFEK